MARRHGLTTAAIVAVGALVIVAVVGLTGGFTPATASAAAPAGRGFQAVSVSCNDSHVSECESLIEDASGKYCLSSFGSTSGDVRQWPCNPNSDNQLWYISPTGLGNDQEIWNQGASCPSGYSYTTSECATPNGYGAKNPSRYSNYGYCIGVHGQSHPNSVLVMTSCYNGKGHNQSNLTFFNGVEWVAEPNGPNGTGYLEFGATGVSKPLFLSTRGVSRSGADLVLSEATKANLPDLQFLGATLSGLGQNPVGSTAPIFDPAA